MEEGLEEAMNIDRQSFRITHPHYLVLQAFVHKFLREEFFSTVVQEIFEEGSKKRQQKKKTQKRNERKQLFKTATVRIETKDLPATSNTKIRLKKVTNNEILIEVDSSFKAKFNKKDWENLEDFILLFELSLKEANGNISKLKSIFYSKMEEWKAKK